MLAENARRQQAFIAVAVDRTHLIGISGRSQRGRVDVTRRAARAQQGAVSIDVVVIHITLRISRTGPRQRDLVRRQRGARRQARRHSRRAAVHNDIRLSRRAPDIACLPVDGVVAVGRHMRPNQRRTASVRFGRPGTVVLVLHPVDFIVGQVRPFELAELEQPDPLAIVVGVAGVDAGHGNIVGGDVIPCVKGRVVAHENHIAARRQGCDAPLHRKRIERGRGNHHVGLSGRGDLDRIGNGPFRRRTDRPLQPHRDSAGEVVRAQQHPRLVADHGLLPLIDLDGGRPSGPRDRVSRLLIQVIAAHPVTVGQIQVRIDGVRRRGQSGGHPGGRRAHFHRLLFRSRVVGVPAEREPHAIAQEEVAQRLRDGRAVVQFDELESILVGVPRRNLRRGRRRRIVHDLVDHDRRNVGDAVGRPECRGIEHRKVRAPGGLVDPPQRNAQRRGLDIDVLAIAAGNSRGIRTQVDIPHMVVQRERRQTPRVPGVVEVRGFRQHQIRAGRQDGAGGDPVLGEVELRVAQEPAADVDRLAGVVVQLNLVTLDAGAVGENFVDDDGIGSRQRVGISR